MTVWEVPVLCFLAVLSGIKSICALKLWNGMNSSLFQIWTEKQMYVLSGAWMIFYGFLWFGSGRSMMLVRSVDLVCTYGILAVVDGKCRIIPDSILLCYFAGQMLLGALSLEPNRILHLILTGVFFTIAAYAAAWLSKGRIGMGDARLLGVTAITAGWLFVLQILILAVMLSFVYSIWLLMVCKRDIHTEFPFVPFLAMGIAVYMVLLM